MMRVRFFLMVLLCLAALVAACGQMGDRYGSTSAFPATGGAPWYKVDLDPDKDLAQSIIIYGDANHYLTEPHYIFDGDRHYVFYEVDEIDLDTDIISDSYIMFATSSDGLAWDIENGGEPVLIADQDWEAGGVGAPTVLRRDGKYLMYYAAGAGIGHAQSSDGIVWEKHDANPILIPDQAWEGGSTGVVGAPSIIHHEGAFHLYYSGGIVDGPDMARRAGKAIGYADSKNGLDFVKRDAHGRDSANDPGLVVPILKATQDWEMVNDDFGVVCSPQIRTDQPVDRTLFRLYYTGNLVGDFVMQDIGIGTAAGFSPLELEKASEITNPIVNERFPLTVFGAEKYTTIDEFAPSAIKKGNSYRMIFGQAGLLESDQGLALAVHPRLESL